VREIYYFGALAIMRLLVLVIMAIIWEYWN